MAVGYSGLFVFDAPPSERCRYGAGGGKEGKAGVLEADERHVSVVVLSGNEIRVVIRFRVAGESRVGMVRLVEGHGHPCLQKTDGERRPLQAVHRVAWLCPATPPYRAKDKGVAARDAEHVWAEAP